MEKIYVGAGAGFGGDRSDAAEAVVRQLKTCPGPRFLVYETLAERTLAAAQLLRAGDPDKGYAPRLRSYIEPVLQECLASNIRIVSNFGAANPRAAARLIQEIAQRQGGPLPRIAIVEGDDLIDTLNLSELRERELPAGVLRDDSRLVSANAYLGAFQIAEALDAGVDIVITGRVADPSLVLGPMIHAFKIAEDDWDMLATGTLAGHLIECGAQVTGGYFADPGIKDVPDMANIGYPIAEIGRNGECVITKPEGTGGIVDLRTVKEQLLYEIHDPACYLTPDVVLDVTGVTLHQDGPDRVRVSGARGAPRPERLKATVCVESGTLAEGEISYAGDNAMGRAQLAARIIRERVRQRYPDSAPRIDFIGALSVLGSNEKFHDEISEGSNSRDIRVRFALSSPDQTHARYLLEEVEALYCSGPAGGAGVRTRLSSRLATTSCVIERSLITPRISYL